MPILLPVVVVGGTGKRKAAEELAQLADVTGAMVTADFEEVHLVVRPGQGAVAVEQRIDQLRAQVAAWREHMEKKHVPKA